MTIRNTHRLNCLNGTLYEEKKVGDSAFSMANNPARMTNGTFFLLVWNQPTCGLIHAIRIVHE
jgi:hypothetical protein